MVLSRRVPSSETAGSYGRFIPNLLKNLHTALHSCCIIYILTNSAGFPFLHILPSIYCSLFFNDGHFDHCEVIPDCNLGCISLIIRVVKHFFMYLLAICLLWRNVCLWLVPIFDWAFCFSEIELCDLFIYSGD